MTVYVTDVNDETPAATNTPYDVTIAEDTLVSRSVAQLTSSDGDTGENAKVE